MYKYNYISNEKHFIISFLLSLVYSVTFIFKNFSSLYYLPAVRNITCFNEAFPKYFGNNKGPTKIFVVDNDPSGNLAFGASSSDSDLTNSYGSEIPFVGYYSSSLHI